MTEDMELSTETTPVDLDGQLQSVYYQRTFNLGNYENEKIGIAVKAQPGQTYEQVLTAAIEAVMKDHKEHDDLREKIADERQNLYDIQSRKSKLEQEISQLTEEKAKLQAAIEGTKVDHPEIVQAIQDAAIKVGDRVAQVGVIERIDNSDETYAVKWDGQSHINWVQQRGIVRMKGVDAPVDAGECEENDPEEGYPEEAFEDEDEDEDEEF